MNTQVPVGTILTISGEITKSARYILQNRLRKKVNSENSQNCTSSHVKYLKIISPPTSDDEHMEFLKPKKGKNQKDSKKGKDNCEENVPQNAKNQDSEFIPPKKRRRRNRKIKNNFAVSQTASNKNTTSLPSQRLGLSNESKNFPSPTSTGSLTQSIFQNKAYRGKCISPLRPVQTIPISLSFESDNNNTMSIMKPINDQAVLRPPSLPEVTPVITIESNEEGDQSSEIIVLKDVTKICNSSTITLNTQTENFVHSVMDHATPPLEDLKPLEHCSVKRIWNSVPCQGIDAVPLVKEKRTRESSWAQTSLCVEQECELQDVLPPSTIFHPSDRETGCEDPSPEFLIQNLSTESSTFASEDQMKICLSEKSRLLIIDTIKSFANGFKISFQDCWSVFQKNEFNLFASIQKLERVGFSTQDTLCDEALNL